MIYVPFHEVFYARVFYHFSLFFSLFVFDRFSRNDECE